MERPIKLSGGGYSYPPSVSPFTCNELHNYGSYVYTDALQPLKAIHTVRANSTLYNASLAHIATYAIPVMPVTIEADYFVAFTFAGLNKVTREEATKHVTTAPIIATIVEDGESETTTTSIVKPIIVWENVSRETFLYFDNETVSTDFISEYLVSIGAVNAYLVFSGNTSAMLRHGSPVLSETYPTTNYIHYLVFTNYAQDNPIQYHLGSLYHFVNRAYIVGGSGGGGGDGEDWSKPINEINQRLVQLETDFSTFETSYNRDFTISRPNGDSWSGVPNILNQFNTDIINILDNITPPYDDTELRVLLNSLYADMLALRNRLNEVTLRDGDTILVTSTMEGVMQWLYDNRGTGGGGTDPTLVTRVDNIETRLDTFTLEWQGEVIMTDTIENVSQWLYNYSRNSIGALTDAIGTIESDISAIRAVNSQQDIDIANRAVLNHASTSNEFGMASSSLYGHIRVSNVYESSLSGYALTRIGAFNMYTELTGLISTLTDRVTALENSAGGGTSDPRFTWIDVTNNASVDQYTDTGWYRTVPGAYNIYVSYDGWSYTGNLQVINPWEDNTVGGLIEPTLAVIQIFYNTSSDSNTSSKGRRIMTLQRVGYASSRTKPTTYTWTPWVPIAFANYDGTDA